MLETGSDARPALKDVFEDHFLMGAALNRDLVSNHDADAAVIAGRHFNSATAENDMKWSELHPEPHEYNWGPADRFVEFCETHHMAPMGHCLIWHAQCPDWVYGDNNDNLLDREGLLARMKDHITTVVSRYRGRVTGWDVVNEALESDGTPRGSRWQHIISEGDKEKQYDFIAKAFAFAHAADPGAQLYYNDYGLDWEKQKCDGAVKIVRHLQSQGLRIDGVGMQLHAGLDYPSTASLEYAIETLAATGAKVMITELDIQIQDLGYRGADIDRVRRRSAADGNDMSPETQRKLADRYAELFSVFVKYKKDISRVTFWGVYDATSWISGSPLLFDDTCQPKPAFDAVVNVVKTNRESS